MTGSRDAEVAAYVLARLSWLRQIAFRLCRDWQRADDLVQATIIDLYVRWGRAAAADHIDAYARTILVRKYLSELRSGWSRRVSLPGEMPADRAAEADPDATLDLREAIACLPPRQRSVVVLRFYCDLSVEQTARELHCTTGTVKSQTSRALAALRRTLGPSEPAGPADGDTRSSDRSAARTPISHGKELGT